MADNFPAFPLPAGTLEQALTDDETRRGLETRAFRERHPEPVPYTAADQNRSLNARRRDTLAAAAVQGILAHQGAQLSDAQVQQVAAQAVRVADALLLELDKVKAR
jgi:hypothetical protein